MSARPSRKRKLITQALGIVEKMAPVRRRTDDGRAAVVMHYVCRPRQWFRLWSILEDLDARESVVQSSRRAARGLKPKRRKVAR